MNIFVTDTDPIEASKNLDNRRLVKMQVETLQLFAYAMANLGIDESLYPINLAGAPYKASGAHRKHPCTLWLQESSGNFEWLLAHLEGLMNEYERRFNKLCSSRENIKHLKKSMKLWPQGPITPFANCTPFKEIEDIIQAYRITIVAKVEKAVAQNNPRTKINYGNRSYPHWYDSIKESGAWKQNEQK